MTELPDWTRGVLLLGKYGTEYLPIVTDSNGNLMILMQGDYQGELRTVALDDEGRLSAFVIDSVDAWERMLGIGNGELAARLGSFIKYDREGSTWYCNDFDNGYAGSYTWGSGTGWDASLTPEIFVNGGYSLKMIGGSDLYRFAEINVQTPALLNKQYGFGVLFSIESDIAQVRLLVTFYDGNDSYSAYADLYISSETIEVVDASSGSVVLASAVKPRIDKYMFNFFKVTMDFANNKYVNVLFNDLNIDCSQYTFPSSTSTQNPYLHSVFRVYSNPGANGIAYLDNFRINISE